MAENKLIIDKITTLRLLQDVRAGMQKYAAGHNTPQVCQGLIEGYSVFCEDENLSAKIYDMIASRVADVAFNPYAFKTTSEDEDKKQQKAVKKSAAQNKATALLQKQITEELQYQQSRGKMTDVPENAVFENIAANEQYFTVKMVGRSEPLQFPVKQNKGKHFSLLGVKALSDKAFAKKGFDEKTFQFLSALGDKGFALETADEVENVGKKYSPSQYKTYLGLGAKEELSAEQKKELEILNSLSASDQNNFIVGVKKRKLEQSRHQDFFAALQQEKNPLKLIADRAKLGALFEKAGMLDCAKEIQDEFIRTQIQPDKENLWNYFNKTQEGNSRFAYYDILMNNLIAENGDIFKNIYDFQSPEEMKEKLKTASKKVKNLATPMLANAITAEVLARGIFNFAMTPNTHADKLKNMNLLLNELGLNIRFDKTPVTKAPDMSIASAQQQAKIDRAAFEEDKRTLLAKAQEKAFKQKLAALGIAEADSSSKHHFHALKYNAFIDEDLNQPENYVQTAREHPWNLDGHQMVHVFDTAGEFLLEDENQKLRLMDFNALRKAYNAGQKLSLQMPVLQVKNAQGKFVDLLSVSGQKGVCGMYISSDKTPNDYVRLPDYCLASGGRIGKINYGFSR